MKKTLILLLLQFLFNHFALAQKELGKNWITGSGISYKVYFNNPLQFTYFDTNFKYRFYHGSSCISDINGNLKLLCNGYQVYDTLGNHIQDGDSLVPSKLYDFYSGKSSVSQSSIILPFTNNIYYIITPTVSDTGYINDWQPSTGLSRFDLLLYHKLDLNIGTNGKVIKKAIPILAGKYISKTQMMACRSADGINWWLLKPANDTNLIYKFLVTQDSIYNMGSQYFTEPVMTYNDVFGQCNFNTLGNKYASVVDGSDYVFLSDFDRCEGNLSNPTTYHVPDSIYQPGGTSLDIRPTGVCFSPNGRFIYVSKWFHLFQLDLLDPDSNTQWYHIANLDTTAQAFQGYESLHLGYDQKLYIGNWNAISKEMSVIDSPNVKGIGCGFCPRCLRFPKWGVSNPPCMPNYGLGKDTNNICWPLGLVSNQKEQVELLCYPNPTSASLTIELTTTKKGLVPLEMFNMVGEIVLKTEIQSQTKVQINFSSLPKGVYLIRCEGASQKVVVQ